MILHNTTPTTVVQLVLVLISFLLAACGEGEMVDLKKTVADMNARENNNVVPLPEFKHIPNYFYEVGNMPDPFRSFMEPQPPGGDGRPPLKEGPKGPETNCLRPDTIRVRAGLELMPIDSLRMVGTLQEADGILWGLVMTIDGTHYRVKVGDYMGVNSGKVINIEENKIELIEQIPNKEGCLTEESPHTTTLALSSG